MNSICKNCVRSFNCVGIQFDFHSQRYCCPHKMESAVTDNKTTMADHMHVSDSIALEDNK